MSKTMPPKDQPRASLSPSEPKIEQVRELLFGEAHRTSSERMDLLQNNLSALERTISERLNQIEQRMESLAMNTASSQRESLLKIEKVFSAMGEQFKELADKLGRT